ncbi:MAG TPA: hypothetical protein VF150_11400 [Thermoanaerobaculia bacterium]
MGWIEIGLADGRTAYRPGEEVAGAVAWSLEDGAPPERAEVRLVWFTRGKGERDSGVAATEELPSPAALDRRDFRLRLPEGPYSFTGKVVSIAWAVEVVVEPGERTERTEIVVSPTGRPIEPRPAPG